MEQIIVTGKTQNVLQFEKAQKTETSKQDEKWQKIQGYARAKQFKRQRNRVDNERSMKEKKRKGVQ